MVAVQNYLSVKLDYEDVTDGFANKKSRRKPLVVVLVFIGVWVKTFFARIFVLRLKIFMFMSHQTLLRLPCVACH